MCTQAQICSGIASINKYVERKTFPKDYFIFRYNKLKADQKYNMCNHNQRIFLQKLQIDLKNSKEFNLESVFIYAVLRWYQIEKIWQFDVPDQYVNVKSNLKNMMKIFDKKIIKNDSNILYSKITDGTLKMQDLFKIQSDGFSLLYKFWTEDILGLAICSTFADQLKSCPKNEAEEHKRFHKMLLIIKAINEKN